MPRFTTLLACAAALLCGCRLLHRDTVCQINLGEKAHEERLLAGFYEPQGAWRWTGRTFAVSLDPPQGREAVYLELDCTLPVEVMKPALSPTLIATVNGFEVGRQTFYKDGRHSFTRYVPERALKKTPVEVQFELDHGVPDPASGRMLGLIAVSVGLKEYEQTEEYRQAQTALIGESNKEAAAELEAKLPPAKQLELRRLFEALPAWKSLQFQGIPVSENPLDLWMMQQILSETRPEFVIQTGTAEGGAALYLAQVLDGLSLTGSRVIAIDSRNRVTQASQRPLWKRYVEPIMGDAASPAMIERLGRMTSGRRTMVILGSDRSTPGVLAELRAYAPLVSRGHYLIVEDTSLDRFPSQTGAGSGPYRAVWLFLAESAGKEFEQDASRELLVFTRNPGGWLRKK
ncbi:MAG: CmcI family methyltransferase [Bryobacteraceae bacterium]